MTGGKGQMFLIGAVVIASAIVVLGFNMASPSANKEAETMKAMFESEMFDNLMTELNATIDVSANAPGNITSNVIDFANFTKYKIAGRSMALKLLFVGTVANRTLATLNVTTLNMLGAPINASLETGVQVSTNTSIANNGRWDTSFAITAGSTYLLNITYNAEGNSGTKETIEIKTKNNKDTYTGFFYVVLSGESANHVSKHQKYIIIT